MKASQILPLLLLALLVLVVTECLKMLKKGLYRLAGL